MSIVKENKKSQEREIFAEKSVLEFKTTVVNIKCITMI